MRTVVSPEQRTNPRPGCEPDELELLRRLRKGQETAFATLVDRYGGSMLRASLLYVHDRTLAEEIVQETWIDILRGLDRFEGGSSLRTWIFAILGNRARRYAGREGHTVPFSALESDAGTPSVGPEHFFEEDHRWAGCWTTQVDGRFGVPEERLLSTELHDVVRKALGRLPAGQHTVMALRDIEGWSAKEVCDFLGIEDENQRVLLHRARAHVRHAIRSYFRDERPDSG